MNYYISERMEERWNELCTTPNELEKALQCIKELESTIVELREWAKLGSDLLAKKDKRIKELEKKK